MRAHLPQLRAFPPHLRAVFGDLRAVPRQVRASFRQPRAMFRQVRALLRQLRALCLARRSRQLREALALGHARRFPSEKRLGAGQTRDLSLPTRRRPNPLEAVCIRPTVQPSLRGLRHRIGAGQGTGQCPPGQARSILPAIPPRPRQKALVCRRQAPRESRRRSL